MKKLYPLSAVLLATTLGVAACSSPPTPPAPTSPEPTVSATPAQTKKAKADPAASDASVNLQSLFTAIDDAVDKTTKDPASMSYGELQRSFPQAMTVLDTESLGQDKVKRLIADYAKNLASVPKGGNVMIDPKTLTPSEDGTVKVRGEDLFVVYKSDGKLVTHKGASLTSDDNLDDVFTMKSFGSVWKVSDINF